MQPKRRQIVMATLNGTEVEQLVDVRKTLADFVREEAGCISVHLGCEHGVCGACTILVDGLPVRSCLRLAVQANGHHLTTLEGLMKTERGQAIRQAFVEHFAMQCGFCTAGFAVSLYQLLETASGPVTDDQLKDTLGGHICRCTGYLAILEAARQVQSQPAPTEGGAHRV